MTRAQLRRRLIAAGVALAAVIGVAVLLKLNRMPLVGVHDERLGYDLAKDMSPLLLGVLAVFLTSWYQQRMTFLQALRSLWSHMIEAKVAMLAYAATPTKTNEAYRSAYRQISRAIEGDIDGNGSPDITLRPTAQLLRTCCVHSGLQIASSDNRLHALALAGFHTGVELEPAPTPQDPWQVAVLCRRHTCHTVEIAAPVVFILGGLLLIEGGAAILGVPALGLGILMLVAMLLFD